MVWYSHLFQNFPQFIVIHTVKGFGTANKAEIDVFLELSCFFHDLADVGNLISASSTIIISLVKIFIYSAASGQHTGSLACELLVAARRV